MRILVLLFACLSLNVLNAQTPAQNKAAVMEFYKAFNGDFSKFDASRFVTADLLDYSIPPEVWNQLGSDGVNRFQAAIGAYKNAFPDVHIKTLQVIAEGNTVMAYIEMTGTFKNDFMGITATGMTFKIVDVDIVEFNSAGKAVAHWAVQDPMVMWAQLGVKM